MSDATTKNTLPVTKRQQSEISEAEGFCWAIESAACNALGAPSHHDGVLVKQIAIAARAKLEQLRVQYHGV